MDLRIILQDRRILWTYVLYPPILENPTNLWASKTRNETGSDAYHNVGYIYEVIYTFVLAALWKITNTLDEAKTFHKSWSMCFGGAKWRWFAVCLAIVPEKTKIEKSQSQQF